MAYLAHRASTVLTVALLFALTANVRAADAFYLGTWKITSAVAAPWWEDPVHPPDPAETKELVGKIVTITAGGIRGPRHYIYMLSKQP